MKAMKSTALRSFWALRLILVVAGVVGLIIALATPISHGTFSGEMSVSCDASSPVVVAACQFDDQEEFAIEIHAPVSVGGFTAFQAQLRWDGAVLDYRPSLDLFQEVIWPDCYLPERQDNRPGDTSVRLGCFTPLGESSYTGALLLLEFACIAPGTSQLTLVSGNSFFTGLDSSGGLLIIDPTLTGATVTCKQTGPTSTATSSPTENPTAGSPGPAVTPPGPEVTPDPVGGFSLDAELRALEGKTSESPNSPWAVVILSIAGGAGLVALGGAAWHFRRQASD